MPLLPCEDDRWLMDAFDKAGYLAQEFSTLNMVLLHQQGLFESNVFAANGLSLDPKYLQPWLHGTQWSMYNFGKQHLPPSIFAIWRTALLHIASGSRQP